MRLLVSVRSAAEVGPAVAGGADIVDAKEPTTGSLGAVSRRVLREIALGLPAGVPLSIALGEPKTVAALEAAMALLHGLSPRPSRAYVKIGLSAAGDGAGRMLTALVDLASRTPLRPSVVAVAYADSVAAGVRGAACTGGRAGAVSEARVAELKAALAQGVAASA